MVSVCIATYNGSLHIREQIDSILPQLASEDEIIVSDDNSDDDTINIMQSYRDDRIRIFHHDASNIRTAFPLDRPTHNFENAIQQAKGDVIFLSDQDDVWLPGKVQMVLSALETADCVIHDCIVTDKNLNPIVPSYFAYINVCQGAFRNIVRNTYLGCCMAFKREVIEVALPFPKTKVGHDLWLGIVADTYFKTTLVRQPLLLYRKHECSMTSSGSKSRYSLWFKLNYRLEILRNMMMLRLKFRR